MLLLAYQLIKAHSGFKLDRMDLSWLLYMHWFYLEIPQ
jgi:hypothetical protein